MDTYIHNINQMSLQKERVHEKIEYMVEKRLHLKYIHTSTKILYY